MKKSNLITIILLIYLGVMAYIGWPKFIEAGQYVEYFAIILVIFLLRVVLRKKERLKRERQQQQDLSE